MSWLCKSTSGWLLGLVAAVALGAGGCSADERWEGSVNRCTDSDAAWNVLLLLDSPRSPSPTGMFGQANEDAQDTWDLVDLQDGESLGGAVAFDATFDYGLRVERWKVDLRETGPGRMEGEAEVDVTVTAIIRINSRTTCKVDVRRKH